MKYCVKCGKELADTARFCPNCGNSLSPESEPVERDISQNLQDIKSALVSKTKDIVNTQDFALDKRTLHKVSIWIAGACGLILIIWMGVIGFYPWDWPKLLGLVVVGAFFAFVYDRTKGEDLKASTERNPEASKWKCVCGLYNNEEIANCTNCGKQKSV